MDESHSDSLLYRQTRQYDRHEADPKVVARELRTNVDNLYNIKKRAIAALTEIALKEVEKYEKEIRK